MCLKSLGEHLFHAVLMTAEGDRGEIIDSPEASRWDMAAENCSF